MSLLQRMVHGLPGMLSCKELDGFIVDWLDEALPVRQRAVFERHLRQCAACRAYLDGYRQAVAAGRRVFALEDATPPPEVPQELLEAILAARRAPRG